QRGEITPPLWKRGVRGDFMGICLIATWYDRAGIHYNFVKNALPLAQNCKKYFMNNHLTKT
ncbi:MAG: hypothetical protein QME44_04435, partial [Thermodesulfobacteriota bacterium]|nr:hypothetical protein [Thermodesulfobacteriota bacterium]